MTQTCSDNPIPRTGAVRSPVQGCPLSRCPAFPPLDSLVHVFDAIEQSRRREVVAVRAGLLEHGGPGRVYGHGVAPAEDVQGVA